MLKTLGWVITVWGFYAALSAYLTGDYILAAIMLFMSVLIMLTNIIPARNKKVYAAMLCVRDEDDRVHQFLIGVADSLSVAGALVKLEAMARQTLQTKQEDFSIVNDYYLVHEREINNATILHEYSFTSRGDYAGE